MHELGERLKRVRMELGYAQKGIAEAVGGKLRSWQDYEAGKKLPGSQVIAGLVSLGINANWILSGDGPMRLADLRPDPVSGWDADLMRQVIEGVDVALDEMDREMESATKAKLIVSIYDLYADTGAKPVLGKIIKFVKSAA